MREVVAVQAHAASNRNAFRSRRPSEYDGGEATCTVRERDACRRQDAAWNRV